MADERPDWPSELSERDLAFIGWILGQRPEPHPPVLATDPEAWLDLMVDVADDFDADLVREVADGRRQFAELNGAERRAARLLIDTAIACKAEQTSFGEVARAQGKTTVALNADGDIVEVAPDGTTRHL